jgi:4-hydroxybenzoate polyprenyltransferase
MYLLSPVRAIYNIPIRGTIQGFYGLTYAAGMLYGSNYLSKEAQAIVGFDVNSVQFPGHEFVNGLAATNPETTGIVESIAHGYGINSLEDLVTALTVESIITIPIGLAMYYGQIWRILSYLPPYWRGSRSGGGDHDD